MSKFVFFCISDSCECESLHSKCPSHTLSEHTLTWCPGPIFHVFSYFARCRCDIDLCGVLVKIFFSETSWPIKAKFYRKHQWEGGISVFVNNPGHMIVSRYVHIMVVPFKILLLWNHWTGFKETWHEALETGVLQCVYKS